MLHLRGKKTISTRFLETLTQSLKKVSKLLRIDLKFINYTLLKIGSKNVVSLPIYVKITESIETLSKKITTTICQPSIFFSVSIPIISVIFECISSTFSTNCFKLLIKAR